MIRIKNLLQRKQIQDLFNYLLVGGIATIVEWTGFGILTNLIHIQYLLSTVLAFVLSTFANWLFGRLLVFKVSNGSLWRELASIYLASAVGLLLNLLIMFVLVQAFNFDKMLAKIVATVIVFAYNYLVRKLIIYSTSHI